MKAMGLNTVEVQSCSPTPLLPLGAAGLQLVHDRLIFGEHIMTLRHAVVD